MVSVRRWMGTNDLGMYIYLELKFSGVEGGVLH